VVQAGARRWTDRKPPLPNGQLDHSVLDDEPEPIRQLRAYSNYLSPRPGLFSADGWVLIAIYLRNALLNQCVLLCIVLALLFAVALVVQGFAAAAYVADIPAWRQERDQLRKDVELALDL